MAALLKNQILKHLSKFTKNLSSDKINLSTLRGEGELSNLELNEDILTQLLELPTWLRITKAVCNRVTVKIQWTKLKSQPICLYLDEVIVETETCEQPRPPNNQNQHTSGSKYGFVDRVMDGIFVHVNSVVVKLFSHKFHASLQLSRVKVQSMSPTWQIPTDLRMTRIRDQNRGEVLLFKEIEWQTTRIEATAVGMGEDFLTPLRLIANQAKIRIVVKKRLLDSAIISSRLTLLLDDLLWVLTITQLKAAILYANSLQEVIERSAQQSKKLAAEKLKKQGHMSDNNPNQQQQRSAPDRQESTTAKHFARFDVLSTSYHLITSRFDLHLCDDSSPAQEEKRHWKINGGSMQITFYKLSLDFYPFHPAGGERKSWYRYSDNVGSRNPWVNKLFSEFREEAVKLRKICESSPMPSSSSAPSLLASRSSPATSPGTARRKNLTPANSQSVNTSPVHDNQGHRNSVGWKSAQGSPLHQTQSPKSTRLLETCFVVKIEDMTIYMVSMPGKKRMGSSPNKLLCSDKRQLHLPPDMSVIHVEYTDYFFPDGLDYPVPHPNMYVLVNPIRITLDFLTLLWSNVFLLTLSNSMDIDFGEKGPAQHVDMKVELLMPRLIVPAEEKVEGQPDRPDAVQLQISKLVVTNQRMEEKMSRDDLKATLDQYKAVKLMSQEDFPNKDAQEVEDLIPTLLHDHALGKDDPYVHKAVKTLLSHSSDELKVSPSSDNFQKPSHVQPPHHHLPTHHLNCNSLKRLAKSDIWSATADQVWLEFLGVQNNKNRPAPFVEAVPVTVWFSVTPISTQCHKKSSAGLKKHSENASSKPEEERGESDQTKGSHTASKSSVQNSTRPFCDSRNDNNRYANSVNQISASHSHNSSGYHHRHDRHHESDGNSSLSSSHRQKVYDEEGRPSRLNISGGGHNGDVTYSNKMPRPDSPIEKDPPELFNTSENRLYMGVRKSHHHHTEYNDDRPKDYSHSDELDSGRYSDNQLDKACYERGHHQSRQRQEKQYYREDSRSSSSPPLINTEPGSHMRDESKERRTRERRLRHSSSSSSDRRDMEGGGNHRVREIDGRSSTEGHVSSDSHRSADERFHGRDPRRTEDYYQSAEKMRSRESSSRERVVSQKDGHSQSYRKARHRSGSGSDWSGGSKERRGQRSSSRERQGSLYERQVEEMERYSSRTSQREEMERKAGREEGGRHSSRETHKKRSQDGSRDERREPMEDSVYDRSPGRPKKRDQSDGHRDFSHERDGGVSDDTKGGRHGGRRHRSHSRGGESHSSNHRNERSDEADNQRLKYQNDHQRLESPKSRPFDADCDNDRFSHTSHSSIDTIGRESSHSNVTFEQQPSDHNHHRDQEDPRQWLECGPDKAWTQNNKRPPPEGCKSQEEISPSPPAAQISPEPEKKICILTKVCGKLRAQLNHFQYLFLLRLSESFSAFQTDLSADLLSMATTMATSKQTSMLNVAPKIEPSPVIVVPLVLKELEFAVVCPYQMHQRTFSDDYSVISPFLQGMTGGHDAVFDESDGTCFPQLVDTIKSQRSKDDSSLKPFQQTITFKSSSSSQLEGMAHLGPPGSDTNQPHRMFPAPNTNPVSTNVAVPTITGPFDSRKDNPFDSKKDNADVMSQSLNSLGKDSGIGIDRKPQRQQHTKGGVGSGGRGSAGRGTSDMKKAFTSAFSSFTDKLKNKMESLDDSHSGGDDDAISIRTDTSDDDFEHLSLEDTEEVPAFFHDPPPPDIASVADCYSEVGDIGDSVSMYAESSTTKGKEMVYIVLFKLDHTELLLELTGDQTTAKCQLAKLSSTQLGNISYEDFQTRFTTAKGYIQEELVESPPYRYPVRLLFAAQSVEPDSPPDPGQLIIQAQDFSLQFKMSGLTCLSDFAEDEKLPDCLPMSLDVRNLLLVLEEDRPPVNLTSPGALPMNVHIQQISIERGRDGIFNISGTTNSVPFMPVATPTPSQNTKPTLVNAVTSPLMSPDGTMALLMASQNEAVLLRRQLEEVRRANRLYEHQILQWRDMQDTAGSRGVQNSTRGPGSGGLTRKRQSFTADSLSSSPSSSVHQLDHVAGARLPRDDVDPARDELEKENLQLQQRITRLEDDLITVSKEKESLLQTLQLLQDELLASERKQRTKTK